MQPVDRLRAAVSDLPFWLEPLYTADEMRALDAWAIEDQGVLSSPFL